MEIAMIHVYWLSRSGSELSWLFTLYRERPPEPKPRSAMSVQPDDKLRRRPTIPIVND
jgi:hypothetical protein